MALLLLSVGVFFGALLALNNLFKTVGRVEKLSFLELFLNYLVALTIVTALVINNLGAFGTEPITGSFGTVNFSIPIAPPDPYIEYLALLACGALAAYSLVIIVLEVFRPWRLKGSRGVFGVFSAGFIALATVTVPFVSVFFSLDTTDAPNRAAAVATARADTRATDPEATDELDAESRARAVALFEAIRSVLESEIDLPEGEVFAQLDAGVPLAQIVEENGGDVDEVIRQLTDVMRGLIADSAERGEIPRVQAALFSSQMGTFIRIAVNSDLNALNQRFGGATPDPQATRASLTDLLTAFPDGTGTPGAPTAARASATAAPTETLMPLATNTPSPTTTPTPTPSITPTRTPPPTATETPDLVASLFADLTRTPIASAPPADDSAIDSASTDGTPLPTRTRQPLGFCLGTVTNNLRLRSAPSRDGDTLLVIPFNTVLDLTARSSDSTWFATSYEGQSGWVDGSFLILGASCSQLPFR